MESLRFILDSDFRTNPRYTLIEWNCLGQPEREALAGLSGDEEVFGIFKPLEADPLLSYKVAYKEVALLSYVLKDQSGLPAYALIRDREGMNRQIARLVLEGILEIKWSDTFVSGPAAHEAIYGKAAPLREEGMSAVAGLSRDALRYVVHLSSPELRALATRLYSFNTIPLHCGRPLGIRTAGDVENFLGIGGEGSYNWLLDLHWDRQESHGNWLYWVRKGVSGRYGANDTIFKMYISPLPEYFPATFQKSIRTLSVSKAFSFKVGADLHGLLRPDKMVVYFYGYNDLMEAAAALRPVLKETRSQGVPFTAQLDEHGLLSWGADPAGKDVLDGFEGGSWRARVTEKLAAAIAQARATGLKRQDIIDYALHKVGLEGIDTHTWAPAD